MANKSIMARLNKIAEFVREKKQASVAEIAINCGIAISTAYQYAKLVDAMFEDIAYVNGTLIFQGE